MNAVTHQPGRRIESVIYETGPYRTDMCGKTMPMSLHLTSEKISHGLVSRLHKYASERMTESGLQMAG